MKTSKLFIFFLFYTPFLCSAQVSEIQWLKNLGGSGSEYFEQIIFTSDSNYLAVGFTTSDDFDIVVNNGEFDYFAVKFDTIGKIIWKKITVAHCQIYAIQLLKHQRVIICWLVNHSAMMET